MFSLTDRATSTLLSREVNETIDENVLKLFVQKNKYQSEFAFFKNDMVCSWSAKGKSDNFSSEVLYVLSEKGKKIDAQGINTIFSESVRFFQIPDYYEYEQHMKRLMNSRDIIRNMIDYLAGSPKKILTEEEYHDQAKIILDAASRIFKRGIHFNSSSDFLLIRNEWDIRNVNVKDQELSFMGSYCFCDIGGSLKKLLGYKILEKIYGTNEANSIYFTLRCEGKIYTAISSFIMEKGLFITGVMANYNNDLLKRTLDLTKGAKILEEIFLAAKRRLVDDIKFVAFQYGDMFALLPYIYAIKREVTMQEALNVINHIILEDIEKLVIKDMNAIAMGVRQ